MKKQHVSRRFVGLALIAALTLPTAAAAQANVKQINARFGVQISVNGVTQHLTDAAGNPVQAFEYNGTTYVPIRGVAQALGAQVGYDASTDTATITTPNGPANESNTAFNSFALMYLAANEMYMESATGMSAIFSGNTADYLAYAESRYTQITDTYNNACKMASYLPSTNPYYSYVSQAQTSLAKAKVRYDSFHTYVRAKDFSPVMTELMSKIQLDCSQSALDAMLTCSTMLNLFKA
ncbi:MAG: copper amine oxidase N-terminal domain-containing protein [Butyricicoccus pullicaecorum]|nr:copper amine oxidase N-terminal domain-containing protein [Butyricicoccus pullicaecorum]